MSLRFAQVIHYYPNYGTAEVVMLDNGQRFQNVTVLTEFISNNSGSRIHHAMLRPASEEAAGGLMPNEEDRSVLAAVVMVGGRPMIIGFMAPPMTQLAFLPEEQNRDLYRHPSGTLATVNKHGDLEIQHSGGAFVRIAFDNASGPADRHQDLTPLAANENWLLPENEPPTITISVGNRDGEALKARVRPNGDTDVMSSGQLHIRYAKSVHVDAGENVSVHVGGNATVSAEGDISARAEGNVTVTAGGDAHVLAEGAGSVVSAGPLLLGSSQSVTIEAPVVNLAAEVVDITAAETGVSGALLVTGGIGAPGGIEASTVVAAAVAGVEVVSALPMVAPDFATGPVAVSPSPVGGGGSAPFGGVEGELGLAAEQVAAATEDVAEARQSIEEGVQEAVETATEARGLGLPDNEGLSGDPAPDVP